MAYAFTIQLSRSAQYTATTALRLDRFSGLVWTFTVAYPHGENLVITLLPTI